MAPGPSVPRPTSWLDCAMKRRVGPRTARFWHEHTGNPRMRRVRWWYSIAAGREAA